MCLAKQLRIQLGGTSLFATLDDCVVMSSMPGLFAEKAKETSIMASVPWENIRTNSPGTLEAPGISTVISVNMSATEILAR